MDTVSVAQSVLIIQSIKTHMCNTHTQPPSRSMTVHAQNYCQHEHDKLLLMPTSIEFNTEQKKVSLHESFIRYHLILWVPGPSLMYALNIKEIIIRVINRVIPSTVHVCRLTCGVSLDQLPSSFLFSNTIVCHKEEINMVTVFPSLAIIALGLT